MRVPTKHTNYANEKELYAKLSRPFRVFGWAKQWHIEFFAFLFAFIRVFRGLKPSVAGLVTWGRVLTHRGDEQLNTLEARENRSQE